MKSERFIRIRISSRIQLLNKTKFENRIFFERSHITICIRLIFTSYRRMYVCTASSIFIMKLSSSGSTKSKYLEVQTTEYTQSGDCRFLAYIPSWWKNHPWLVRVGGARPSPSLSAYYHHYKVGTYAPAERADRREIVTVRGQSYVSRLPKYWPPTPSPPGECVPRDFVGGGGEVGGQYFGRRET